MARALLLLDIYKDLGYDVVGVGAKDLSASGKFLRDEARKRGLVFVSANLLRKERPLFPPFVVLERGGLRIGITAVTARHVGQTPHEEGIRIEDPEPALAPVIEKLRKKTDLVILLSSLGEEEDTKLLARVKGIDILVGSGPGTRLNRPERFEGTHLLRPNEKGKSLGEVTVLFDRDRRLKDLQGRLVLLTEAYPEDEGIRMKIEDLHERSKAASGQGIPGAVPE